MTDTKLCPLCNLPPWRPDAAGGCLCTYEELEAALRMQVAYTKRATRLLRMAREHVSDAVDGIEDSEDSQIVKALLSDIDGTLSFYASAREEDAALTHPLLDPLPFDEWLKLGAGAHAHAIAIIAHEARPDLDVVDTLRLAYNAGRIQALRIVRAREAEGRSPREAADALRWRWWLANGMRVGRDKESGWTCWIELPCIPYRSQTTDPDALTDELLQRFPLRLGAKPHQVVKMDHADTEPGPKPLYRHGRTGGLYRLLFCNVWLEWEPFKAHALYQCEETAQLWLRPEFEFFDGRFIEVSEAAPELCHQSRTQPDADTPDDAKRMEAIKARVHAIIDRDELPTPAECDLVWLTRCVPQVNRDPLERAFRRGLEMAARLAESSDCLAGVPSNIRSIHVPDDLQSVACTKQEPTP